MDDVKSYDFAISALSTIVGAYSEEPLTKQEPHLPAAIKWM